MRKCPRCRAVPTLYRELWKNHAITFAAQESGIPEPEGWLSEGEPYAVEAECDCGHKWRLRGVIQITDLGA